ncbi:SET domain-containing protein [uncultured Methanofollis sp.]|uniref:SET domain-containing protein n=1 Tax=uncultured Methanofollis sp. TaxID=262500 RepID=UPI0026114742|nr:SET domain-containing protein [uncultured Methanofollis sp.]
MADAEAEEGASTSSIMSSVRRHGDAESTDTEENIHPPYIVVGETTEKGRGVFAARDFLPGEVIEVCPVIVSAGARDEDLIDRTNFYNYYFAWGEDDRACAIALGYGSLYNHSYHPNADHRRDFAAGTITVTAYRHIRAGEEITINYTGPVDCRDPVWFDVAGEE